MNHVGYFFFTWNLFVWIADGRISADKVKIPTINTKVKIPTTGCLLTDKGSFCFDGSMFQSSYTHKGSAHYTSYIGGKKYTYSMQEIDDEDKKLFSDKGEVNLEGIKYKCTVESAPSPVNIKNLERVDSKTWKLDHWIIPSRDDGEPISIATVEKPDEPFVYVSGTHPLKEKIAGCDPDTEGDKEPKVPIEIAEKLNRNLQKDIENQGQRRLVPDWAVELQQWASGTYWCGSGTDTTTTPCPDPNKESYDEDYDYSADHACRRHDHGAKYEDSLWGVTRLECCVDNDINEAGGDNWAVATVYGSYSFVGGILVGCLEYETYYCWDGWFFGTCGPEWGVNYGPWRYDGCTFTDGYTAKQKVCEGDLPGY